MISFIITAKNEKYLQQTIDDIFEHAETDIEVLVGLDGYTPNPQLKNNTNKDHKILIYRRPESIGQRAMVNELLDSSQGDIICKVDAHCSFGQGFDKILLEDLDKKTVIAPYLLPLDGENWIVSHHNKMANYVFDENLVMQHTKTEDGKVVETMCMQGSFFMCYKDFFYKANLCDESLGSWGSQGIELGLQAWYNGGKCLTSKKTYYGHVFRHDDKDFPYKRNQKDIDATYNKFKDKYLNKDLGWLIEKFNHPMGWSKELVDKL